MEVSARVYVNNALVMDRLYLTNDPESVARQLDLYVQAENLAKLGSVDQVVRVRGQQ